MPPRLTFHVGGNWCPVAIQAIQAAIQAAHRTRCALHVYVCGCASVYKVCWLLEFYVLATFKDISGQVPTCGSVRSWLLCCAAPFRNQAAGAMTRYIRTQSRYNDTELGHEIHTKMNKQNIFICYIYIYQEVLSSVYEVGDIIKIACLHK